MVRSDDLKASDGAAYLMGFK